MNAGVFTSPSPNHSGIMLGSPMRAPAKRARFSSDRKRIRASAPSRACMAPLVAWNAGSGRVRRRRGVASRTASGTTRGFDAELRRLPSNPLHRFAVPLPLRRKISVLEVRRLVPQQEPRPWAGAPSAVVGVVELAAVEREAAAADAAVESVAQALQHADALVEPGAQTLADGAPVGLGWRAAAGQRRQLRLDLTERQAQPLRDQCEREPPDVGAREAPLVAARPVGGD